MHTQPNRTSTRTTNRRAVLIFAVLACLTLAAVFSSVWLRMISLEREQTRLQQSALQAEYLAESALARAEAQLAASAEYAGETWQPDSLGSATPASVAIEVAPTGATNERTIVVTAELLGAGSNKVVRRREHTVELVIPEAPVAEPDAAETPAEAESPAPSTTEPSPSEESSP